MMSSNFAHNFAKSLSVFLVIMSNFCSTVTDADTGI